MQLSEKRIREISYLYLRDGFQRGIFKPPKDPENMPRLPNWLDLLPEQLHALWQTIESGAEISELSPQELEDARFLVKSLFKVKGFFIVPMMIREQVVMLADHVEVDKNEALVYTHTMLREILDDTFPEATEEFG